MDKRHRIIAVVKQPEVTQTSIVGFFYPLNLSLREVRSFGRPE